jgi:ketosteroid isomerase-like protein
MRSNSKFLQLILLVLLIGIAGCSSAGNQSVTSPTSSPQAAIMPTMAPEPTAIPAPTVDPAESIVMEYVKRVNAEDYAGAAELFADDAMAYFIGMPPTGMEIYWGREQYRAFLEACCTGQNFEMDVTPERVAGGIVYAEAKTWMDFTRDLGVAPNSFHEIFVVEDSEIKLYASTMTEEALTNFKPVLYEAIPELAAAAQPPVPSDETPVSAVTVTIMNNTCAYSGPMTFQEGELIVNVAVQDQRFDKYAVTFFTLDEGKDLVDLMASTHNPGPPSWSDMVFIKEVGPGVSATYQNFFVQEGLLYMVCWAGPPDIAIGNAGPFVIQK